MSDITSFLQSLEERETSSAPYLGGTQSTNSAAEIFSPRKDGSRIKVRYFVASLLDDSSRLMLEQIMTTSLNCGANLSKVGDIVVFDERSTFTKEGEPIVVVKYAEIDGGVADNE